ncbi:MAG TPA: TIGR02757 family protein [Nitratifractor sp.]|nr:TIGR02757 family protein [Nitratifractor sp.]
MQKYSALHKRLEVEVAKRNSSLELSFEKPDPLLVAKRYNSEYIALICALFGYGNATQILKFLDSLEFDLLYQSETEIKNKLQRHYYRFQKPQDVIDIFITIKRLMEYGSIEEILYSEYRKEHNLIAALSVLIETIWKLHPSQSYGYKFFFLKPIDEITGSGTYKRYFMYFRWMVRKDNLDMGLWKKIDKKDLIMPLDTHTFNVAKKLKLLKRKSYDLKAAIELTERLKQFDSSDPVKYDFALYRLGQEQIV